MFYVVETKHSAKDCSVPEEEVDEQLFPRRFTVSTLEGGVPAQEKPESLLALPH